MNFICDVSADASGLHFNPMPSGWYYQNMLIISRMHQEFTLPGVDEKARRVLPEFSDRLDEALMTLVQKRYQPYKIFAAMLFPALNKAIVKSAQMQTFVDAARVACALERYRLTEGKLPENLDALVPRFIETIPTDVIDGKPLRLFPSESERCNDPTVLQAFQMISGPAVHELIASPENRLARLLTSGQPDAAIVAELYWSALTRAPAAAELKGALADLAKARDALEKRAALEDLLWGLLNAKEFSLRR
mgnify:CR=1 FL=1